MKNNKFLQCVFIFVGSFGVSQGSDIKPENIYGMIKDVRDQHTVAAVTVLVVNQDEVLFNSHTGVRDWNTRQPFSSKDMYRIGSISKSFAGILALKLQKKGLINLNSPITDYGLKPYLKNAYPDNTITLAQLLEHTAGLGDLKKAEWDYNDSKPIGLKEAFELKLGDHKTLWEPGIHRSYSNVGPGLFGLALELKLGKTYEALMQEHVFDPLKMTNSSLLLTPDVKSRLITGYDRDGKKIIPYWHNIYRPFAAINTNNQDMVKWLQMLLKQDHDFMSQTNRNRLIRPTTTLAARNGLEYGYGLGVYSWQVGGHSFYGHGGDADGYLTRYGVNPESGLAYFVMINAFNKRPLNEIVDRLERQIIADLPKPKYPRRLKPNDDQLSRFVGSYRQVAQRFSRGRQNEAVLEIISTDGQLSYQYKNGRQVNIYRVKADQFRTTSQSVATMAWVNEGNSLYFQGELGNFVKIVE